MTLNEYQYKAMQTCMPESDNALYMLLELAEEVGELQGKFSKAIRHGSLEFNENHHSLSMNESERIEWRELVKKEIGDILWGVAGISNVLGFSLEDVALANISKLRSRQNRGKIDGAGDVR